MDDFEIEFDTELLITSDKEPDIVLECDPPEDLELIDSSSGGTSSEVYDGPYEAEPIFQDDQVLSTKDKLLINNVTIKPIRITTTINPSGGKTVLIG